MDTDLEALGTNAHELPMVLAALADSDEELLQSPYKVLQDWQRYYGGNLLIVLPDAFGTAAFLRDAPDWVADWTGFRPDSAPPIEGGEKIIEWWRATRQGPEEEAADLLRRARRRDHRGDLPAFPRQGAHGVRLGHQPHQRFRGLRADRDAGPDGDLAGLQGHRGQWPPGGEAFRQSRQGDRRSAGDRPLPEAVRRRPTGSSTPSRCERRVGPRRPAFDSAEPSASWWLVAHAGWRHGQPLPTPPSAAMCSCLPTGHYIVGGAIAVAASFLAAMLCCRPASLGRFAAPPADRCCALPMPRPTGRQPVRVRCSCWRSSRQACSAAATRCPIRCRLSCGRCSGSG